MGIRFLIGLGCGAVITFALFYIMQALIHSDGSALRDAPNIKLADFLAVQEDQVVERKQRKPKPPPKVEEPPPDIPKPDLNPDVSAIGVDISGPNLNANVSIGLNSGFTVDGEYLPIVKVKPQYPRRALTRGIEGHVLLEFTVTKTGAVDNPRVIESVPPGIFDRAAVQAALKFKYKPKVVNGEGLDVPGVRNLIKFELADEG